MKRFSIFLVIALSVAVSETKATESVREREFQAQVETLEKIITKDETLQKTGLSREKIVAQARENLFGSTKDEPDGTMILINTAQRDRRGICYIGKAIRDENRTDALTYFRTKDGKIVPVQCVSDPDERGTCSLYADFSWNEDSPRVPAGGTLELTPLENESTYDFSLTLSVDPEVGEMRNDQIQLRLDSGSLRSFRLVGIIYDLVSKDAECGLGDFTATETKPPKMRVLTEGPLVASVLLEYDLPEGVTKNPVLKSRQITIFADTEKVKIENVLQFPEKPQENHENYFAFPFSIREGEWRLNSQDVILEKNETETRRTVRSCVLAGPAQGMNWVTLDTALVEFRRSSQGPPALLCMPDSRKGESASYEFWLWPYQAGFNAEIAARFARETQRPLLRIAVP